MEEQDVYPLGSSEPYTAVESIISGERIDIPRMGQSDSQLPNLLCCDFFYPSWNQAAHYSPLHPDWDPLHWLSTTRPTVISPEQIPETSVPMTKFVRMAQHPAGPSRIKKILLEEPIRNSIRGAGATCSSVTPTNSALHPTISHHVYHHGSWKTCEALTLSNAIRTKESKHQSLANFNGSQKWELRRVPRTGQRAPRSGRAITKVAIKAMDGARKLYGT
ncbi:hypothetical protein DFH94DRAFT_266270 [Russula ochroleuca]|uniref:Uncharacterized protein n=1 Tax=Russula ochroleuca TaxID=152965 RepID=A0A9P5TD26_9AGAM|nr:hypothetical protein DFH94DRAFT_266270 [Russula ochroleuca]